MQVRAKTDHTILHTQQGQWIALREVNAETTMLKLDQECRIDVSTCNYLYTRSIPKRR